MSAADTTFFSTVMTGGAIIAAFAAPSLSSAFSAKQSTFGIRPKVMWGSSTSLRRFFFSFLPLPRQHLPELSFHFWAFLAFERLFWHRG